MELKHKIIFFIVTTLLLGTITYFIISNIDGEEKPVEQETATIEEVNYEKYMELRSKVYENETFAILVWESTDAPSKEFFKEIEEAFKGRKAKVYTLDTKILNDADYSRVVDDITNIMKYDRPMMTVPTLIVMTKGEVIYTRVGLMYREELIENLDAKGIE